MDFEWSVVVDALPALFKGAQLTVLITLAGLAGGIVLGIIAGLMRAYGNAALNGRVSILDKIIANFILFLFLFIRNST